MYMSQSKSDLLSFSVEEHLVNATTLGFLNII